MQTIGIDPGVTGGIAVLDHRLDLVAVRAMPAREKRQGRGREVDPVGLYDCLMELQLADREAWAMHEHVAAVEAQQPYPGQGVTSTYTTGYGMGVIEGVLATLEVPSVRVKPREWKVSCGVLAKPKHASIAWARARWPHAPWSKLNVATTLGVADAACIAYHIATLEAREAIA